MLAKRSVARMCTTIMSRCDVVIAAENADIADTHLNMGLAAADGCNSIWLFHLGFLRTKDLLFNAQLLTASQALDLDLVTQVVPQKNLDQAVDDYVRALQLKPTRALQLTKVAVNFHMKQLVLSALESGLNLLEKSNFSIEHKVPLPGSRKGRRPQVRHGTPDGSVFSDNSLWRFTGLCSVRTTSA